MISENKQTKTDIVNELEMTSKLRYKAFEGVPRSMSALERAVEEIKRLRSDNEALRYRIYLLEQKAN
jgi:hypothetical protein